ncbi:sucrase-isomaltase, intestinal-like [Aphidius gifuensis]|nr:sucrase-isomaltase, intestinal-like [Aphidius gifuensis]
MDKFLEAENTVHLKDEILLSPITKYLLPTLVLGMILISSVYVTMLVVNSSDDNWISSCEIQSTYYVNCLPGKKSNYEMCISIGCCWSDVLSFCYHSNPSSHGYTQLSSDEIYTLKPRKKISPLGSKNRQQVFFNTSRINENHFKFSFNTNATIEEKKFINMNYKLNENLKNTEIGSSSNLSIVINNPEFSITVYENNNSINIPIFTTSKGPLILTDNYWEMTLLLGEIVSIYGLNRLELNGTTSWNYDTGSGNYIPAFVGINSKGFGIGCVIDYLGPLESEVLDKSNLIILRGMSLPDVINLHVFIEITPLDVVKQMSKLTKQLNPSKVTKQESKFELGLHVCPDNNKNIQNDIETTILNMNNYNVPWNSHCVNSKFYQTLDETMNKQEAEILKNTSDKLIKINKIVIPHLSPLVSSSGKLLQQLSNMSLLLLENSMYLKKFYVGMYNNDNIIYPNWFDDKTLVVYENYLLNYLNIFKQPNFIYVENSWPIDETNYTFDFKNFDYMPKNLAKQMTNGTIPPGLLSSTSKYHYQHHNEYSMKFINFINKYTIGRKIMKQNNIIGWTGLRETIIHGVGCGFVGQLPQPIYICGIFQTPAELCTRWYAAAVVFPYIIAIPENLPGGNWLNKGTSKYASKLLQFRHSFLTYKNTLIHEYNSYGQPVLAPTFIHYPLEEFTSHALDQFMWGESILVGLVITPGIMQVKMHIPGNLSWRHLQDGLEVQPTKENSISIVALESELITLVRPGYIVPLEKELSGTSTVKNSLILKANLACITDGNNFANGKIGYAVDTFLYINFKNNNFTISNIINTKKQACIDSSTLPTVIHSFEILGDNIFEVDIDICQIIHDNYSVLLNK